MMNGILKIIRFLRSIFVRFKKKRFVKTYPKDASLELINLHTIINQYRLSEGLDPLLLDVYHCELAEMRIEHIIKGEFSHDGLPIITSLLNDNGLKVVGENLARHYFSNESVLESWINSPEHNKNLLKPWKFTGFAIRENYYCQVFSK
jgi:uncharacterized protein YkwD